MLGYITPAVNNDGLFYLSVQDIITTFSLGPQLFKGGFFQLKSIRVWGPTDFARATSAGTAGHTSNRAHLIDDISGVDVDDRGGSVRRSKVGLYWPESDRTVFKSNDVTTRIASCTLLPYDPVTAEVTILVDIIGR